MSGTTGRICAALLWAALLTVPVAAQPVGTAFTYQGRLADGGTPASGPFDLRFILYDAVSGGSQVGPTVVLEDVAVVAGLFTVNVDFGGASFVGSARFMEVGVRPGSSTGPFTVVNPRQAVSPTPYSVRSLNAGTADNSLNLGGLAANQYVITTDPRLSDARNPLPGSASYIQNSTAQQPVSNFSISGNGAANLFNAAMSYNIGGSRVLSIPGNNNVFAGVSAGAVNATGGANTFIGRDAGSLNTTANANSFVGSLAGQRNTSGSANSFVGSLAGQFNQTGIENAFFGFAAGQENIASSNSFFGYVAGSSNTSGTRNAYFGHRAGNLGLTGNDNSLFGYHAGQVNTASNNSFFGSQAGDSNTTGSLNSFFGTEAGSGNLTGSANSFFGYRAGFANTAGGNTFVGNFAGASNTSGGNNVFVGNNAGFSNMLGSNNVFVGNGAGSSDHGNNNTLVGSGADVDSPGLSFATAIGAGARVQFVNWVVIGRFNDHVEVPGSLSVGVMLTGASTPLCRNMSDGRIGSCASSLRYKEEVETFIGGLEVVRRLRPITFTWKDGGMRDVGFGAEEVEGVEPLLVTYNGQGQVEGVKYGQVTTVLVNAVNEQQAQIEALQERIQEQIELSGRQAKQIAEQQRRIDALEGSVCRWSPGAVCP